MVGLKRGYKYVFGFGKGIYNVRGLKSMIFDYFYCIYYLAVAVVFNIEGCITRPISFLHT